MAVVRAMTPGDLAAVIFLATATPEAPHWERSVYEEYVADDHPAMQIFVAEDHGRLVGFVAAHLVVDVCELESIAVDSSARRSGIGKALLGALMEWARQYHVSRIELEVRAGNSSAIGFYEHSAFAIDGLRRGYYRNPQDDAVLMSRPLESEPSR